MGVGAIQFNGSSDGLSFSHISALDGANKCTFSGWVKTISNPFFGYLFGQVGATGTGTGNTDGLGFLQSGTDATSAFIYARNASNNPEKSATGLLSTSAFIPFWGIFDGTQGTVTNRLLLWLSGSAASFTTDTNNFPTTLGTNNQPFTVGFGEGSLFDNVIIADLTLRFGVADTNSTNISDHANGKSGGFFVQSGDLWIPALSTLDDVNRGVSPTVSGSPTIVTGPSITYPSGLIIVPEMNFDPFFLQKNQVVSY